MLLGCPPNSLGIPCSPLCHWVRGCPDSPLLGFGRFGVGMVLSSTTSTPRDGFLGWEWSCHPEHPPQGVGMATQDTEPLSRGMKIRGRNGHTGHRASIPRD